MYNITIVGGCGHIGIPLALILAENGHCVTALDIDFKIVSDVNSGILHFQEEGLQPLLNKHLGSNKFVATTKKEVISDSDYIIVVIGTPVDEFLNPNPNQLQNAIKPLVEYLKPHQHIILRSTVYPEVTKNLEVQLSKQIPGITISFCPERVAEGQALKEIISFPQIIGANNEESFIKAEKLFKTLDVKIIRTNSTEAELAKLFTNSWRYIKFAASNQFFMLANELGHDYVKIRNAIISEYPRASDIPSQGFAAGPCLLKDTMQLAAFSNNTFSLGNSAMLINEGLPVFLVRQIEKLYDLSKLKVGILGMSFKSDIDDVRSSLSYKLKKILEFKSKQVYCADRLVNDSRLVDENFLINECDLIIISTAHSHYKYIESKANVIDLWNLTGKGIGI
jgi:UDP-N-acetyl-D-mannosaminuronic acid dehydrogenase